MTAAKAAPGLVIRFDGSPGPVAGRFIEAELDGVGVNIGEWKQDGDHWLLVLDPALAAGHETLAALQELVRVREETVRRCGEHESRLNGSDGRYDRARAAIAKAGGR